VTELGRSRPTHTAKATKGRRRGPPCGKDGRASVAQPKDGPPAGIGRKQPPKERTRGGHVFWPPREKKERPPGRTAAEPPCGEGQRAALLRSQKMMIIRNNVIMRIVFEREGGRALRVTILKNIAMCVVYAWTARRILASRALFIIEEQGEFQGSQIKRFRKALELLVRTARAFLSRLKWKFVANYKYSFYRSLWIFLQPTAKVVWLFRRFKKFYRKSDSAMRSEALLASQSMVR